MLTARSIPPRLGLMVIVTALLGGLIALPVNATDATVTGTLTIPDPTTVTAPITAIVTIIDQTADADAGAVIGQQRIEATALPLDFAVVVGANTIDPTHAYALFATLIAGTSTFQNPIGEPVITGGPSKGLALVLPPVVATPAATLSGTFTLPTGTVLGTGSVQIAALIKVETGTLVDRQVIPIADPTKPLTWAIGFDPSVIDPAATYVVKGGIVEGATVWENRTGVAAITGGTPATDIKVPLTATTTGIPGVSPSPSGSPSGSAPASTPPSASATATTKPTETPTASPTATPAPTASPTATPTAAPTASPTATPAPTASATLAPSNAPSASPITGPLTGTLTYKEPHTLSRDAYAVVALVRGSLRATESSIVATEIIRNVGSVPVSFSLEFDSADIDPTVAYTVQATIVDGANAWVTGKGVPVLTEGNPKTVAITLTYRPDLVKGSVTGQITAVGLQPAAGAYAIAILLDATTGESLGIDVRLADEGLPVAFGVPYLITDVDPNQDYVIEAEVGENGIEWRNAGGVPVITKGNPKAGVQVVVTQVAVATPAPTASPTPTASPAPSAAPAPTDTSRGSGALGIILLATLIGAAAVFFIARGRGKPDAIGPDGSAVATTTADTTTTEPTTTEPTGPADTTPPGPAGDEPPASGGPAA